MTLDEVINYNRLLADMETKSGDLEVAEYYLNTAKGLEELKELREQKTEYKRLLKAAVDGFKWLEQHTEDDNGGCIVKTSNISCGNCPFNTNGADCKWKHEAEALKLIGDEPNGI